LSLSERTRNSEVLESFVAYARAHPEQRFWQALLNWSGFRFILVSDLPPRYFDTPEGYARIDNDGKQVQANLRDTWSFERRDG
jgi:hypothetical protein